MIEYGIKSQTEGKYECKKENGGKLCSDVTKEEYEKKKYKTCCNPCQDLLQDIRDALNKIEREER